MKRALTFAAVLLCVAPACVSSGTSTEKGSLVPFGPAGLTDAASTPVRRALIVGIETFDDERLSKLQYPAADARAMASALEGFEDVTVLTGAKATRRSAVLAALNALSARATHPSDTVFVYFSTHGSLDYGRDGELERFIITTDSRLDLVASTAIALKDVLTLLNRSKSQRVVLILAACHSGTGKSQLPDALSKALRGLKSAEVAAIDTVSEAKFVLSAAAFGEAAREDDRLGHDVYTYYFLEGLREGDRDQDGAVTVSEAHDFARARTYDFTAGRQRPSAESVILGVDPIILAGERARTPQPTIYSYASSAEGLVVEIDGTKKGRLPGGIAVEAGEHRLELRRGADGEVVYRGSIDVSPGERTDLSALLPRPAEYEVRVGPAFFVPIASEVRSRYFPISYGFALAMRAQHLGLRNLALEATMDTVFSSGTADEALPFNLFSIRPGLRAGLELPVFSAMSFEATGGGGVLFAGRSFHTPTFEASEALVGPWFAVRAGLAWTQSEWLRVSVDFETGVFWGTLGADAGPHLFLAARLGAGLRFE